MRGILGGPPPHVTIVEKTPFGTFVEEGELPPGGGPPGGGMPFAMHRMPPHMIRIGGRMGGGNGLMMNMRPQAAR